MRRWILAAAALGLGCLPYYESPRTRSAPAAEPPPPLADRLAELADALDPGPQPPLSAGLSPWIAEVLEVPATPPAGGELLIAMKQPLQVWDAVGRDVSEADRVQALIGIARAVAIGEGQLGKEAVDIDVLLTLERAYTVIDRPELDAQEELLARHFAEFARVAQAQGQLDDQRKLAEAVTLVRGAVRSAGALHRSVVARILRVAPDHPEIPGVLARAAAAVQARNDDLAVGAMRLSVEIREGAGTAKPNHYLQLAATCYQALELACGREAVSWASTGRADPKLRERFAEIDALAKLVAEAAELTDRADVPSRLRRGEIMLSLRRWTDAEELFRTLHRQHPEDARAVTGLARHAIASRRDFHAAYQLIERNEAKEHRDTAYFELAIGVRATTLVRDVLPKATGVEEALALARPYVDKLREDIVALEKSGGSDGVVLHFVLDRFEEAVELLRAGDTAQIRKRARALLPSAVALQAKAPKNLHAYRILLSAASLSADPKRAFKVVDAAPPELGVHKAEGALRRALALLDLVVAWEEWERLPDVLRYLGDAKGDLRARVIRGHVAALQARRSGNAEGWIRAEELYRKAAADPASAAGVRHNLAVTLHELGKPKRAATWWARALERASEDHRDVVRLHQLVSKSAPRFVDVEPFATSADEDLALLALRWAVKLAPPSEVGRMRKALKQAEAKLRKTTLRPTLPPGAAGVLLKGNLSFNLGYDVVDGLKLTVDLATTPWLVLAP